MTIEDFLSRLEGVKRTADGWTARCPAHGDRNASLSIGLGQDGRILLRCFAGCAVEDIVAAIGLKMSDLYQEPLVKPERPRVTATYTYKDPEGRPLIRVLRYQPKSFRRQSPDGKGGWRWGKTGRVEALYRWPELRAACGKGATVYLVEGEKDADNLAKTGRAVTTALGGASHWVHSYGAEFAGAGAVVIIADNDEPGRKHALAAAADIRAAGVTVRAICLPSERNGRKVKDVSDWLAAGPADELEAVVEAAEEIAATPPPSKVDVGGRRPPSGAGEQAPGVWQDDLADESLEGALAIAKTRVEESMEGSRALSTTRRREIYEEVAIEWLRRHGGFYHDKTALDRSGAMYFDSDLHRLYYVSSDWFQSWLSRESAKTRIGNDYRQMYAGIEDAALAADFSQEIEPSRYWERKGLTLYLSCGDGRMCKMTPNRVEMVDNGTDGVLFRAGRTLSEWTLVPEADEMDPRSCTMLGTIASVTPGADLLITLWMMVLAYNYANKPPLVLFGTAGSGKTRLAVALAEILGLTPPRMASVTEQGEEDFWTSVDYGGISILDNTDTKIKWLPDAIAAAATGGTREKRRLYTDSDLLVQRPRSAIVLTTIYAPFAADPGLADRLIPIRLERRRGMLTADSALTAAIVANRDAIMSWMVRAISRSLAVTELPPSGLNRRHPDWAAAAWRCAVAIGCEEEATKILREAEIDKSVLLVQSNPVVGATLLAYMEQRGAYWEGNAAQLYEVLSTYDPGIRDLTNAHAVGRWLNSAWPQIQVVFHGQKRTLHGTKNYRLSPCEIPIPQPSEDDDDGEEGVLGVFPSLSLIKAKEENQEKVKNGLLNTPNTPPPESDYLGIYPNA